MRMRTILIGCALVASGAAAAAQQPAPPAATPGTVLITGTNRGLGLEFTKQYVLINNAGVLGDMNGQQLGALDPHEFAEVMAVNVFGALAVSEAFRDHVAMSALVSPPPTETDMLRALIGPENAAFQAKPPDVIAGLMHVIDGLTMAKSGQAPNYFDGTTLPW